MKPQAKQHIAHQIAYLKANKDVLTIDADTHISDIENLAAPLRKQYSESDNYYHGKPISAEDLIAEMEMAGVDMCLSWQNPAVTLYGNDRNKNFDALLSANQYVFDRVEKYPNRIIPGAGPILKI